MSIKIKSIGALFVALVIILAVKPSFVNNIYSSILGRLLLVSIVVFFSMNNVTLGLLLSLVIIAALNQFGSFSEGMTNQSSVTIGDDNVKQKGQQKVLTDSLANAAKKISDLKKEIADGTIGIDKENIKLAIMPKDSKQIPVDSNMNSSSEVEASSSGMLNSNSAKLEGFSSFYRV